MNETPLIKTEQLLKVFPARTGDVRAVDHVDLTIHKGEAFGLAGESGSGKSTLGRLIMGLESPTAGTIHFDGMDLTALSPAALRAQRPRFQMIFQDVRSCLNPRHRIETIVSEPLRLAGQPRAACRKRVRELLDHVGLPATVARRRPGELSGGQRQRVGIARAMATEPECIIADEPVSALDVSVQAQILNLLRDLRAEHNLTYLFISHDLAVVEYLCDRVGIMQKGQLVEVGSAADIFQRPQHPYTQELLASVCTLTKPGSAS